MRSLRIPLLAAGLMLGGAGAALAAGALTANHTPTSVLEACANGGNGNLRLVDEASDCHHNEEFVSWNVQGPAGPKGDKGDKGATGPAGPAGPTGPKGDKGDPGATGAAGPKGDKGDPGATGAAGPKGDKGDPGATGATGPAGATGPKGDKGDAGATGSAGAPGPQGEKGDTGATGPAGATGATGSPGATGATGPPGATGPKGDKGDPGDTGATGPAGPPGAQGPPGPANRVFSGSVNASGEPQQTGFTVTHNTGSFDYVVHFPPGTFSGNAGKFAIPVVTSFGPLFTAMDGVFQAIPLGPIAPDGSAAFDVRFASGDHFFTFVVAVSIS